jgi:hypothetical protein
MRRMRTPRDARVPDRRLLQGLCLQPVLEATHPSRSELFEPHLKQLSCLQTCIC